MPRSPARDLPSANGNEGWLSISDHLVVDHHGQGEAAREAHAHHADAGPAQLVVQVAGERTQPR